MASQSRLRRRQAMTGFGSWRTQAEDAVSIRVYSGGRCQYSCVMVAGKSLLWLVSCQYSCVSTGLIGEGSIPACAGEPDSKRARSIRSQVYPRVCGGTAGGILGKALEAGLSPRVRGNPDLAQPRNKIMGSIPACAGEPRKLRIMYWYSRVYPRVCGGTLAATPSLVSLKGLSPRVRGNLAARANANENIRSIPACAGEPG